MEYSFQEFAQAVEAQMEPWLKLTAAATRDSRALGSAREWLVSSILEPFLPKTVVVGRGQVTDGTRVSNEIDIVIYRADFPVMPLPGNSSMHTYFHSGVVAAIQVKSDLRSGRDLKKAFENLAPIHQWPKQHMRRVEGTEAEVQQLIRWQRPSTYVVGYRGWKRESCLLTNFSQAGTAAGYFPDVVYYPSVYLVRSTQAAQLRRFGGAEERGKLPPFVLATECAFALFFQNLLRTVVNCIGEPLIRHPSSEARMVYLLDDYLSIEKVAAKPVVLVRGPKPTATDRTKPDQT